MPLSLGRRTGRLAAVPSDHLPVGYIKDKLLLFSISFVFDLPSFSLKQLTMKCISVLPTVTFSFNSVEHSPSLSTYSCNSVADAAIPNLSSHLTNLE